MSRPRGGANHCSLCGAPNRTNRTHLPGMTRAEHVKGAVSYCRDPRSAQDRATDAERREAWVGRMVTMPDNTRWKVLKHINGSLYELASNGKTRMASHSHQTANWVWWNDPQPDTPPMTRQEAMRAMDEAVEDLVAQEDEAATKAPPTEDSDTVRLEVLGARLEYEDGHLFVVFKVGPDYFSGRLDRYIPPEFDPLDLIRKEDD